MVKIEPLRRKSVSEEVVERIIELISEEVWKPGESIPHEKELASSFNVSRTTIREALKALYHIGFLEMEKYKGFRVTQTPLNILNRSIWRSIYFGARDYNDLLDARMLIEPPLAALATKRISNDDIAELKSCILLMESECKSGNHGEFEKADRKFHELLARASGNKVMIQIVTLLRDLLWKDIPYTGEKEALEEHQRIYEAVASKDAEAAQEAMAIHLINVPDRIGLKPKKF